MYSMYIVEGKPCMYIATTTHIHCYHVDASLGLLALVSV